MKNQEVEKFSDFYEAWITQLECYLHQLKTIDVTSPESAPGELQTRALISKLTGHHKKYCAVKWAAGNSVLAFSGSPSWFSPLETAYSWLDGWKPSAAFCVLDALRKLRPPRKLAEMAEIEVRRMEQLRTTVRMEEKKVEREMERHQQFIVADRMMLELARLTGAGADEPAAGMVEVAVKRLEAGLERVMKAADLLRLKTLKGILDILTPAQNVEFLTGASVLQIRLRQWVPERV